MPIYDLTQRGRLTRYEYLYRCLRGDIVSGAIAAQDRLPSKRAMARNLGVSLATVEAAYGQLVAEGYVESRPRSGYYVAELPFRAQEATGRSGRPHAPAAIAGAREAEGPGRPSQVGATDAPPLLADFSRATTSGRSPAAALWGRALRQTLAQEPESALFCSQPPQGTWRLREAIARHLADTRGMAVDPERVVVGAGAQVLYVLITQLLGQGRTFAVEDPGYPTLARAYRACGASVRFVGLDAEGIGMAGLRESGADVVHLMPSHQFPTGRVTSIARRYEVLGWASQAPNRWIVEDDYDRELRLAGMPIPPLQSIDAAGRVIYVSTFSKSLSSALRMAYLVLPPGLDEAFAQRLGFYSNTVSVVDQVTLARLFESGEYARHVRRYRTRQREVRDQLVDAIQASGIGPVCRVEEADSGLHFVLAVETRDGRSEDDIARRAASEGVVLAPLSSYVHDPGNLGRGDAGGTVRFVMQYEGLDVGRLPEVMAALERAFGVSGA